MMAAHRDLLALLLVWEIGKPWRLACADVDRGLDGVRWYVEEIDRQLGLDGEAARGPLPGPVCNIASWNYPMSVQVHAELVQALAGNAVVAKTPTQGGFHCLTLAHAFMARAGLPVTLLSGAGSKLGEVLISSPALGALAFVGGRGQRPRGRRPRSPTRAAGTSSSRKGSTPGASGTSASGTLLAQHVRKGFEYAKQRCTAYPRFVVQRRLLPAFLAAYLPVLADLRFGHPLAVAAPDDPLPELDFGPVISARKAAELADQFDEALARRGRCRCTAARSATAGSWTARTPRPTSRRRACWSRRRSWSLHHAEPFGPLDSVVCVDTEAEFLAAMNASNGCLVASIATDDADVRRAGRRAAAGVQGRDQQAAQPRRPRGGVRRHRRVVEGRVRRRRPARARRDARSRGRRRAAVRQLPELLQLPGPLILPVTSTS